MRKLSFLMIAVAAFLQVSCGSSGGSGGGVSTPSRNPLNRPVADVVPSSFFGMHMHRASTTTPWPGVSFGSWRLWDSAVTWSYLEPTKGNWNFTTLDKLVALAEQNDVELLLVFGRTPHWASARPDEPSMYKPGNAAEPANIEDWRSYVRTVATRYKGRIRHYEIWNEPNHTAYYTGTIDQLVTLAQEAFNIIKEIDPSAVVLTPSATADGLIWLSNYLSRGGGNFADVIGYHFYVGILPPEATVTLINRVQDVVAKSGINKPLWNTEAGWSVPSIFPDDEAAAYVARSYILNWAAGVDRFYWYAWDNRNFVTLRMTTNDDVTLTPAAIAYGEIQKWLIGAQVVASEINSDNTWIFQLQLDGGYAARIVWNPDKTLSFNIPAAWGILQTRDLTGAKRITSGATQIQIGPSPLLLENTLN